MTQKRNKIFLCFKNDMTAVQATDICGMNRNTASRYHTLLRRAILRESIREARRETSEYEFDESYFDARRRERCLYPGCSNTGESARDGSVGLLQGVVDACH